MGPLALRRLLTVAGSTLEEGREGVSFPDRHVGFRVFEVIILIKSGAYPSTRTIAERFECSRRTAERYVEKIRDLVAPDLTYDRQRQGYYFARGGPDLPAFKLTEGEAAAIFLAARLLEQCRGTPYEREVEKALAKLAYLLPKQVTLADVPAPAGWVSFRMEPLRGEERKVMEVFLRLEKAREARETVRIRYFTASRGEWNERAIDPYHLHFADGAWYVFAYCHWRQEVKMFALDRIESIEETGRHFEVPADFSAEKFMANSFKLERGEPVDVAIRFGPEQARYVRGKQWHPSQRIEELGTDEEGNDRGLILRMKVGGMGEVKRWVLSFGAGAEVLEPEGLREAVRKEAEALTGTYGLVRVGGVGREPAPSGRHRRGERG